MRIIRPNRYDTIQERLAHCEAALDYIACGTCDDPAALAASLQRVDRKWAPSDRVLPDGKQTAKQRLADVERALYAIQCGEGDPIALAKGMHRTDGRWRTPSVMTWDALQALQKAGL